MARTTTGVDVGTRTAKFLRGQFKNNTFQVSDFAFVEHDGKGLAEAWRGVSLSFKPTDARIGVSGRDVNVRYTRVPRVPDWQLRKLMRFEVEEVGGQSGSEVASDFNVLPPLPEIEGEDVVLLAMARESLLQEHLDGLAAVGGKLDAFSPSALALYNAWLRFGVIEDETVLLADIGHDNLDVILVRGPDLLFARNLTGGSQLFDKAIADRFGVSLEKAERIKIEQATLAPGANYRDGNQEKASRACQGAAGQLLSLLQSAVMFCKSQVKLTNLRVDKVLLCGGGAGLEGLTQYLASGMGVSVELFDPWRVVDTSALSPDAQSELEEMRLECVVALGLATMASDPDAYSVEILPDSLRKRREFMGSTLFLIAAAAVGLLYLGWHGWNTRAQLLETQKEVTAAQSRLRSVERVDKETRDLIDQNQVLEKHATLMQGVAGSGEQLARILTGIESALPEGFWITELNESWTFRDELGITRDAERPIVKLSGRAREGTDSVASQYVVFLDALRRNVPGLALRETLGARQDEFTMDLTLFAPPPEPSGDGNTGEGL